MTLFFLHLHPEWWLPGSGEPRQRRTGRAAVEDPTPAAVEVET